MDAGSRRRFNLQLLDHDECLLESAAVVEVSKQVEGRLWICSKCVVFEPKDFSLPLEKLRFEDMESCPGPSYSQVDAIVCDVAACVEMKTNGKSHPYIVSRDPVQRTFALQHRALDKTLALVESLWRARHAVMKEPRATKSAVEKKLLGPVLEKRLNQPFDKSRLTDFREVLLTPKEIRVSLISQMVDIPGCIMLTDQRLYFQPALLNNIGEVVQSYSLTNLTNVYKRRFLLRQRALEIRFQVDFFTAPSMSSMSSIPRSGEKSLLLCFEDGTHIRDLVYDLLERSLAEKNPSPHLGSPLQRLRRLTLDWQKREISNFEYLMQLNTLADRSIADLTQYPVFPWVIADYTSAELNLEDPKVFRDLSKPIGALNAARLEGFRERFRHMQDDPNPHSPPFLYGTHYTTPGYVLYFLVRKSPDLMLRLQNGQFDRPDRSFNSIEATWRSVLNNPADLKELIPEFYESDGEFLLNVHQLDLGKRQDGTFVDDVILPPWCSGPRDFITKCREALESEYVSQHLHEWIDLIFGFKQRGEEAIKADNLFYYLTYEGAVDLDRVEDEDERKSYEDQIYEFGQTPKQLFVMPHPRRDDPVEETHFDTTVQSVPSPVRTSPKKATATPPATEERETVPSEAEKSLPGTPTRMLNVATATEDSQHEVQGEEDEDDTPHGSGVAYSGGSKWWSDAERIRVYSKTADIVAHRGPVSGMSVLSRSPGTLCSVSLDGSLSQVSLRERSVQRRMAVGKLSLSCCVEGRDDSVLVGSWDNSIYSCSLDFGRVTNRVVGHEDAVSCISCSSSGRAFATGSWESSVKIWSVSSQDSKGITATCTFFDHTSEVTGLEMSANGQLVVSCSSVGDVFMHDVRAKGVVSRFEGVRRRGAGAVGVFWSTNESSLVVCADDGIVDVMSLSGKESLFSVGSALPKASMVTSAGITPDKLCALMGTSCGRVSLCNVDVLKSLSAKNSVREIWRQSGENAAVSKVTGRVMVQSPGAAKGTLLNVLPKSAIASLTCTVQGDTHEVLVGTCEGVIRVLEG